MNFKPPMNNFEGGTSLILGSIFCIDFASRSLWLQISDQNDKISNHRVNTLFSFLFECDIGWKDFWTMNPNQGRC